MDNHTVDIKNILDEEFSSLIASQAGEKGVKRLIVVTKISSELGEAEVKFMVETRLGKHFTSNLTKAVEQYNSQ